MPIEKICQQCSMVFHVPKRRSELVKFCSLKCKQEAGYETHTCGKCGVEFKRKRSDNANTKVRYCSVGCDHSDRAGRKHLEKPGAVKHFKKCEVCSTEFRVTATRKDTARFCSVACKSASPEYRKQSSEAQKMEKSWRWKGGLYYAKTGYVLSRTLSGRRKLEHRNVVADALAKVDPLHPFLEEVDGLMLLKSEIEVHHIDRDRSNNSLSNLLAVTKSAHAQIHHRNKKPEPHECWPSNPEFW